MITSDQVSRNRLQNWRKIKNKIAIALSLLTMAFGLFWLIWILFSTLKKGWAVYHSTFLPK